MKARTESEALLGVLFCLTHMASAIFMQRFLPDAFANEFISYCWPLVPVCQLGSWIPSWLWSPIFLVYFISAATGVYAFWRQDSRALKILMGLTIGKAVLMSLSYRSMGNYHFMPLIASLFYIFGRSRQEVFLLLYISFYIFAGLLKLNVEWLSGASLGRDLVFGSRELFQWALAFTVILEILLVPLILVPRTWIRILVFSMILLFHILSYFTVGWFYPVVMILLGVGVVHILWTQPKLRFEKISWSAWTALAFFAVLQISTRFMGDLGVLDGTRRLHSLNMYDARAQCLASFLLERPREWIELAPNYAELGVRVRCDPILYLSEARSICREKREPEKLGVYLRSKTTTGLEAFDLLRWENFCDPSSKNMGVAW